MNTNPESEPSGALVDPRNRAGFQPTHFPRADGQEAPPPDATEPNDRIKLKFLAAYNDLNGAHARLVVARQRTDSPAARADEERKCLQEIERLLILRDRLEDHYAPLGVIADSIVQDGVTVNVKFSFGNVDAFGRRRSEAYTITACVPIPLPRGTKFEDMDVRIEGPGISPE